MARTLHDAKLDTRASRLRLRTRREPYWRSISGGMGVGYRKGAKGGTWIGKLYSAEHGRRYQSLGKADDVADADGSHVLSFAQAQEAARKWFTELGRQDRGETKAGPHTVRDAMMDYLADYERRGGKALYRMQTIVNAHILPTLGDTPLTRLTRSKLEDWFFKLAKTPARLRTEKGEPQRFRKQGSDLEATRRRRSTANRILNIFKACLNHAYQHHRIIGKEAWATLKPFREADAVKVRYLTDVESRRLVNACPADLRAIVTAALLTGARYGELAALTAADFNPDSGTLHISRSKGGKVRHIALTAEGRTFFTRAVTGKASGDLIFRRASGSPWRHVEQFRPMREACKAARITPAIGFHALRHTYAARLAMRAVPLGVIAAQLGHAGTRVTEKNYAHLAPNYVAKTVRAAFGKLGILKKRTNVVPMRAKA